MSYFSRIRRRGKDPEEDDHVATTTNPEEQQQEGNNNLLAGIVEGGELKISAVRKISIGVILIVIIVALAVGISAIVDASKSNDDKSSKNNYVITPSSAPTMSPSISVNPSSGPSISPYPSETVSLSPSTTFQKNPREEAIELALRTLSNNESLEDPSSPQSKAIDWLVQDELEHGNGWDEVELTQRYVLAVLYHSTGGENWSKAASWVFQTSSVCLWRSSAIRCNESGEITSLYLLSLNLRGTIPVELGALTALENLHLYANSLTGTIPSELGLLSTTMRWLHLSLNTLTGPIPTELGQLTALLRLELYYNRLSGPIPSELGLLAELEALDMYENFSTGPIPSDLGHLTALSWLSLNDNSLVGSIPSELGLVTGMRSLELYENFLTGPIPSELGQLTPLERLHLNNNSLTGTVPIELTKLTSLDLIYLHGNDLTGSIPSGFCADPFPDWKDSDWQVFATDCTSQVQCDCCNRCYNETGNCFVWSKNEADFVPLGYC